MRITGGIEKGRRLKVPAGSRVRPTSDKVKQALFNILGENVSNATFLDLYAGTGGVGIEALSRGADCVYFIDDSRESINAIKQNIEQTGFLERTHIITSKAESFLRKTTEQFNIVFLDPPYTIELQPLLEVVAGSGVLKRDAVVIAEHFKKQPSPERAGSLVLHREAQYGDTVLAFYKTEVTS